jgi:4-amino-4-deoxy-L-arabinose transferase-like glycosyltransferase
MEPAKPIRIARAGGQWLLGAIVATAAVMRLWHITELPPGYWYDEAHKSLGALQILRGERLPIYFTDGQGIEAGYFWLLAAWFRLFGPSYYGTRVLSALLGTATIPLTYWAVRVVYRAHPRVQLIALASAGWPAFLVWHVNWSRLGFENVAVPLFGIALFGLMAWAWQQPRPAAFVLGGAVLGLSLYTNPAARLLPVQALLTFAIFSHGPWRRRLGLGAAFLASAAIVFAPLGLFFIQQPQWFVGRIALASANTRAGGWPIYAANAAKTLLAINFRGDANPRHNLALRPVFDPISSAWMLLGLFGMARARAGNIGRAHLAVMAAIVVNLAPAVFSDDAPAFGRTLTAAPFLVILPALGLALAFDFLRHPLGRAILLGTVLLAAVSNGHDYFYRFPRQPGLFDAFEVGQWTVLQAGAHANSADTTYLLLDERVLAAPAAQLTARLALGGRRVINAEQCLAYPAVTTVPTVVAVLERWRLPLAARLPGANVELVLHEPEVYAYAAILSLPAGYSAPAAAETAVARLGGAVDLLPAAVPAEPQPPGTQLPMTLRWRVSAPLSGRYNVFIHLVGPGQPLLAGADGEPCGGWYPTTAWHVGEIVEHSLTLTLPPDLPLGQYDLVAGLYDLGTGARLPVDQNGAGQDGQAFFGRLQVGPR